MKSKNIFLIIALLALVYIGYTYGFKNEKNLPPEMTTPERTIISDDGEEVAVNYPETASFSNRESNASTSQGNNSNSIVTNTYNYMTSGFEVIRDRAVNTVQKLAQPFMLAFVYKDTLDSVPSLAECKQAGSDSSAHQEIANDSFDLQSIEFKGRNVYISVDSPIDHTTVCAKFIQFNTIDEALYDAVYVVVE